MIVNLADRETYSINQHRRLIFLSTYVHLWLCSIKGREGEWMGMIQWKKISSDLFVHRWKSERLSNLINYLGIKNVPCDQSLTKECKSPGHSMFTHIREKDLNVLAENVWYDILFLHWVSSWESFVIKKEYPMSTNEPHFIFYPMTTNRKCSFVHIHTNGEPF